MKKVLTIVGLFIGINATAQVATSGTNNSGTNASAIGYQSSATNTVSTAIGRETLASGITSTAMGYQTSATNTASTAMGNSSTASGVTSTAIGNNSTASGETSIAMGFETEATDSASIAMGYQTTSTGGASTAMGFITTASGFGSTSIGYKTTASGYGSTSIGYQTTASGNSSTAIGKNTIASDFGSLVIGQYNLSGSTVTNSATEANYANTAFVIGNGTASNAKSDAFKVMFNGNTTIGGDDLTIGDLSAFSGSFTQRSAIDVVAHSDGDLMTGYINGSTGDRFNIELDAGNSLAKISSGGGYDLTFSTEGGTINFESNGFGTGTYAFNGNTTVSNDLTVSGDVVVSSDARLKANIVSLGSTLSKLLLIDGKSYTMKKDGKQKIGLLAQEIREVFPELVSEDANEMLAVNYQGLVPVLINALKEQQAEIDKLKEQEHRLEKLEKLIHQLKK